METEQPASKDTWVSNPASGLQRNASGSAGAAYSNPLTPCCTWNLRPPSFNEGATSYDEVIAKLGQPAERHEGITVDYRYEETSEKGKGFDAILGGVGKTRTVNECVTLVFDGKTKKLLQKRMTECDSKPSALSTK